MRITEPVVAVASSARNRAGHPIGRFGSATRERLLDQIDELVVKRTPWRQISIIGVSRMAGSSSATFYQYFPDMETAVLAVAGRRLAAGEGFPPLLDAVLALLVLEGWVGAKRLLADAAAAKESVDA